MAKKHVLIDIRPLLNKQISGVQVYTENLLNALKKDKTNKYTLYYNSFRKHNFSHLEKYFPIEHTKIPNKIFNIILKLKLIKIDKLIKTNFDVLLCPDLRPTCLSKNIKKIQVIHDFSFISHKEFFSKKTRAWFKLLDAETEIKTGAKIISVSKATNSEYLRLFKKGPPGEVISPFIKNYKFSKQNQKKYFIYVGTLEPRKNLQTIIKVFKKFHKTNKNIKLLIAGRENKQIFKGIKKEKSPGIKWLGQISEKQKEEYLKKAIALIYISKYEGFGLPVAEAISIGTPCLISDIAALKETAGNCALISKNEKRLLENMKELMNNEKKYLELKNNCKIQKQKWRHKLILNKWLKLFKDI